MGPCKYLSSQGVKDTIVLTARNGIATLARLMVEPASRLLDVKELVERQQALTGTVSTSALLGLSGYVQNDACVTYSLCFRRDNRGKPVVTGNFTTTLDVICQRCMQPMTLTVANAIHLGIVTGTEDFAEQVDDGKESLIAEEGKVSVARILEEEILLALPLAPLHEREKCTATEMIEDLKPEKDNPFSVLKDLKIEK